MMDGCALKDRRRLEGDVPHSEEYHKPVARILHRSNREDAFEEEENRKLCDR